MARKTIEWCRGAGWEAVESDGLARIFPIMAWSGHMSAQTLKKHGFEVVSQEVDEGIKEGVVSQRLGYHGEEIKRIWAEQYSDISDGEAAVRYALRLRL